MKSSGLRHSVSRLGGDEFVILFINTLKKDAENIFIRFNKLLDKYNQESERRYQISFSCGVVELDPAKHETIESLLEGGDSLMYESKKSGRIIS